MPDAVIDSTVLVSAFLTARPGGASYELLRFAADGSFTLHLSPAILRETEDVLLTRKHLRDRFTYSDEDVHAYIARLTIIGVVAAEPTDIPPVVRDPNDDMVIACAVAVAADFLVSRDRDLLDLKQHLDIVILSPEDFLARLRTK